MQFSEDTDTASQLKRCVFVGPSLFGNGIPHQMQRFGPAQLGSIYLAAKSGYEVIGLIDGLFGNVPAVWHKEILYALDRGCVIIGSSSIGALRAAELHSFGMCGVGLCFRLYRAGVITDDDEVSVVHGDQESKYVGFSEPLVNIRATVRRLRRNLFVTADQERRVIREFKALHFSERTFANFRRVSIGAFGKPEGNRIYDLVRSRYRDVKKEDAQQLVKAVIHAQPGSTSGNYFLRTTNWRRQFELCEQDLKALS